MAWVCAVACVAWSHATFRANEARQLAHRWRPVKIPLDDTEIVFNNDRLRKYTRALVQLRRESHTFGVCGTDDHKVSLYIFQAADKGHILTAVLWPSENEVYKRSAARELTSWHRRTFKTQFIVGTELERADRLMF